MSAFLERSSGTNNEGNDEFGRMMRTLLQSQASLASSPSPLSMTTTEDASISIEERPSDLFKERSSHVKVDRGRFLTAKSIRDDVFADVMKRHNIQAILARLRRVIKHPLDRDDFVDATTADLTDIEVDVLRQQGLWVTLDRTVFEAHLEDMASSGTWHFLDTRPYFVQLSRTVPPPVTASRALRAALGGISAVKFGAKGGKSSAIASAHENGGNPVRFSAPSAVSVKSTKQYAESSNEHRDHGTKKRRIIVLCEDET